MSQDPVIMLLSTAIIAGTPLLYAALGELLCERSGNLNLGVEGMMLIGAVGGFAVTAMTGNAWIGLLAAMLCGGVLALIHAFLTITLRASQVVSGLAMVLFGTGLSSYLGKPFIGFPSPATFAAIKLPLLGDIPYIGPIFFAHDMLVYISYFLTFIVWIYLYRTRFGLHLRAVGENPAAADAMGINVFLYRYVHVFLGGVLAGVGGAYLSLSYAPSWLENMTAGRGWIAVALVIFATWDPLRAMLGAYLFGALDVLGFRLQTFGITVSPFFLQMLPYIFTIVVLIIITYGAAKKFRGQPAALGVPYDREER